MSDLEDTQTQPTPGPPFYATGPCTHCGYDLRGTSIDDNCPECGRPALDSSPKWPLSNDTPAGLRTRLRGATTLFIAATLIIVGTAGLIASVFVRGPLGVASMLTIIAGFVTMSLGLWWVASETTQAPAHASKPIAIIAMLVTAALLPVSRVVFTDTTTPAIALAWFGSLILAGSLTFISTGVLLHRIAQRIPERRTIASARRYHRWAWITSVAVGLMPFVVWGLATAMNSNKNATGFDGIALFLGVIFMVGAPTLILALICTATFVALIIRLRKELRSVLATRL